MNTPINSKLAKLLNEKGFDSPCDHYYYKGDLESSVRDNWNRFNGCSAPTITEVIMWLYEKYGIWIFSKKENNLFQSFIQHPESINNWFSKFYNSPTEAYKAAIEYYLTTLP